MELETTPFVPVLEPVSRPTQSSETTELRAKQPRLGERVYPTPLPMQILSTPRTQRTTETVPTNGTVVTLQVIASLGPDVELGDVKSWNQRNCVD